MLYSYLFIFAVFLNYFIKSELLFFCFYQKRFKRLRRVQDEESEEEDEHQATDERDAIASALFEGSGDVSFFFSLPQKTLTHFNESRRFFFFTSIYFFYAHRRMRKEANGVTDLNRRLLTKRVAMGNIQMRMILLWMMMEDR